MKKWNSLKIYFMLLFLLGVSTLGSLLYKIPIQLPSPFNLDLFIMIICSSLLGIFLGCMQRKLLFRKKITYDQSISYEVLMEFVKALGPLLPKRTFEAEILLKDTELNRPQINFWYRERLYAFVIGFLLSGALISCLNGYNKLSAAILALVAAYLCLIMKRTWNRHIVLLNCFYGVMIWGIQGAIFVYAASGVMPFKDAVTAYVLVIFIMELMPLPLGLGIVELPALLFENFGAVLLIILVFHITKILPVTIFGIIFLRSYKFSLGDLFSRQLNQVLDKLRTPADGRFAPMLKQRKKPLISIIIPAYNEAKRLPAYLTSIMEYIHHKENFEFEILIVDDGSQDDTVKAVNEIILEKGRFRLIEMGENQGKGAAIRVGIFASAADYILFTDADGATPITELDRMLEVYQDSEIIVGIRNFSMRRRKKLRALAGKIFYSIVNLLAVPGIRDTQCGFKMLRYDVAIKIFTRMQENRWAFDVEMLYLAQMLGFSIREIPIRWREVDGSKLSFFKDSLRMLWAVFRIRNHHGGFLNYAQKQEMLLAKGRNFYLRRLYRGR